MSDNSAINFESFLEQITEINFPGGVVLVVQSYYWGSTPDTPLPSQQLGPEGSTPSQLAYSQGLEPVDLHTLLLPSGLNFLPSPDTPIYNNFSQNWTQNADIWAFQTFRFQPGQPVGTQFTGTGVLSNGQAYAATFMLVNVANILWSLLPRVSLPQGRVKVGPADQNSLPFSYEFFGFPTVPDFFQIEPGENVTGTQQRGSNFTYQRPKVVASLKGTIVPVVSTSVLDVLEPPDVGPTINITVSPQIPGMAAIAS